MILEYNVFFSHLAFFSLLRNNSEVLPDFHGQEEYKKERGKRMDNKEKKEWRERDKEVRFLQRWFTKFIGGYIIIIILLLFLSIISLCVFTPLLNILSLTMGDFEFGSSLSTVFFDAHPSLGGHTPFKEEDPNGFDITPIVSPSLSSLSSIYSPTPIISSPQGGLFKTTIEMNRIEYCTRSRLLENSDHAYFAIFLASKYINNNTASLYPHVFAYIDSAQSECAFHSRVGNKFEVNTISMGFIKGKNLAQQFPSRTQRTKSTNFSTTLDNKTLKYTYVCIPEQENKWFEHRWKIESDNGGSYYLCVDVPGPGVKRKRTVKVAEKSKTQKIFHETQPPNSFSFTWCPVSPVSSPSLPLSPTPSRSSSFSSISSPPSVVPCSPTTSISPLSSPFISSSPIISSSVSSLSPTAPYLEFLPCSNPVPALTSVQDLDLFLTSLCSD